MPDDRDHDGGGQRAEAEPEECDVTRPRGRCERVLVDLHAVGLHGDGPPDQQDDAEGDQAPDQCEGSS